MNEHEGQRPLPGAKPLNEVGGFEITGKIGQGGMGAVFKARQRSLDRVVALKILPPHIAKDKTFIDRFLREARASAKLSHPNVVAGIDVGQDDATGLWYFAMEYVDGPTARQLLREQGRLPEDQALKIVKDIAGALECAHQNGIVHRDVKPDNILLDSSGTAKLADLGLARRTNDDAHLTQSGMALGTPFYMAPEQVRGEVDHLDTRADLYALGATLFHLVTGQTPFQGETSAVIMARHLSDAPPVASRICPDVSAGCSRLIVKLMQKEKSQRVQTPTELIDQIDRLLRTPAATRNQTTGPRMPVKGTATTGSLDSVRSRTKSRPTAAGPGSLYVGIGVAAVLLLVLAGFLFRSSGMPPRTDRPVTRSDTPPAQPDLTAGTPGVTERIAAVPQGPSLERRWLDAKAFAAAQPEDFEEILRLYGEVRREAGSTALAAEVKAGMDEVERNYQAAAQTALAEVEKRMRDAASAGDYATALAAATSMPPALARLRAGQLEALRQTLCKEAEGKIRPVMEKAAAVAAETDPDAGLKELESIAHITFPPLADERRNLKQRLENERTQLEALGVPKAQREAMKKLAAFIGRFDNALLDTRDEAAAARIAKEAEGAGELEPVRAQADALQAILDAIRVEQKRQEEALSQLKGHPFTVDKTQGTIDRIADGNLYVKIAMDGGKIVATRTLKIADLSQARRDELFPPPVQVPDALRVAQALQHLTKGRENLAAASELLAAAPNFPLTPHYLELIRSRKAAVLEAEAKETWTGIVAASGKPLQEAGALGLLEKLTAFSTTFGETQFVAGHAEEITALKSQLDRLANPNLIKNGKTLVSWVYLANTTQRGGSALTVQIGPRFDAIVFGEKVPGKWIAGSDFWKRTPSNQGAYAAETADPRTLVQMANVYDADRIAIYRNGELLVSYPAANIDLLHGRGATVVFGLRHIGTHGGNLQGAIEDARVYDRCLSAEQIKGLVPNRPSVPEPWAWWDFEGGESKDRMGRYTRSRLVGGAQVENGKLILRTPDASLHAFAETKE